MSNIAVLIPTFKPGKYIENCLSSIENQTLPKDTYCVYIALNGPRYPYENYVLNILNKKKFQYKYFYIPYANVSNARNVLLKNSTENFIVFIDDDDIISKNYLENLVDVTTEKYIGIANVYNFEKNLINLKENYIGKSFKKLNNIETNKFRIRKYFSSLWAKMFHRKMIENIMFDKNISKGEDSLFMAIISKNIDGLRKTSLNTCYYVYEREGSVTRSKIKISLEIKINFYLLKQYFILLFEKEYDKTFISTRIVATYLKLINLIKFW
jgi:glycosyltransferase involved in cell wall biosynthesis